jgi:glycosyltransferase involved in cell wall biosynthesis
VKDSSDIAAYVAGIEKVLARGRCPVPARRSDADLIPRLWCLIGQYGRAEEYVRYQEQTKTLFLTDNLNLGGAARSLVNLLCRLPRDVCRWVAILNECNHQAYLDQLEKANIPVFSLRSAGTYLDSTERVLQMTCRLSARTLVFWNADARVKLLLAKILPRGAVRLIDVSPAKWLYEDLDRAAELQWRIGLDRAAYFDRLDHFVAKYSGGGPADLALHASKFAVIPNGVPDLASEPLRRPPELPRGSDPELVIGTCCRILPSNRLEFLVDVMAELNLRLPGCLLVVVGATLPRHVSYFKSIQERMRARGVANIHFAGQQADVVPFLRLFRLFVIFANDHGCPNASLEAMSVGLPILANPAGGTVEQVEHGSNGFLVSNQDPRETAHRIRTLLTNPKMRQRFGEASRKIARERFSMETMVERYSALLGVKDGVFSRPGTVRTQPMAPENMKEEKDLDAKTDRKASRQPRLRGHAASGR